MIQIAIRFRAWTILAAVAMGVVITLVSSSAFAGPYLNTAAMLLHESANAGRWVRLNLGDKELASNAYKMARARTDTASKMNVPAEVRQAHPHLLLSMSAMESAMQAAVDGKPSEFIRLLQTSSGEATTFRAVLQTLGFALPDYGRSAMNQTIRLSPPGSARLAAVVRETGSPVLSRVVNPRREYHPVLPRSEDLLSPLVT